MKWDPKGEVQRLGFLKDLIHPISLLLHPTFTERMYRVFVGQGHLVLRGDTK